MAVIQSSGGTRLTPWNKPRPQTPAPKGYEWYPVYNADQTQVVGWTARKLGSAGGSGGAGGGGGGGYYYGSSGGRGGGDSGLSAYIQTYRIMFGDPKANPPKELLSKAKKGNWSTTYFQFMVRQTDPKYFRSAEAKQRMADLRLYMRAVGVGLNKGFARRYLREGWSETQLQNELVGLKAFKKKYPDWAAFAKAQRAKGAAKMVDPLAYRAYQTTFRNAFKQAGVEVPEGWERSFFKSGITDEEFVQNFSTIGQTQAAAQWDIGGLTPKQTQKVMFSGAGSAKLRNQLQQALQKQQRFFQKSAGTFGTQAEGDMLTVKGL